MAKQTATFLIFLFGVLGATYAADVARQCGDTPSFDSVVVTVGDNVCTEPPCKLVRGESAKCLITFTTVKEVSQLVQKINATVVGTGITTNFPVPDADKGCDKLADSFCPLNEGETATIELSFDVLKIYPLVSLELVIAVLNELSEIVACFQMSGIVSN